MRDRFVQNINGRPHLHTADTRTCTSLSDRAFPLVTARMWNGLPSSLRASESLHAFCSDLKTHSVQSSFDWCTEQFDCCLLYVKRHFNRFILINSFINSQACIWSHPINKVKFGERWKSEIMSYWSILLFHSRWKRHLWYKVLNSHASDILDKNDIVHTGNHLAFHITKTRWI